MANPALTEVNMHKSTQAASQHQVSEPSFVDTLRKALADSVGSEKGSDLTALLVRAIAPGVEGGRGSSGTKPLSIGDFVELAMIDTLGDLRAISCHEEDDGVTVRNAVYHSVTRLEAISRIACLAFYGLEEEAGK
jgi:hypothetical protein